VRTEDFFRERASRANIPEALRILDKAGFESPQTGDELPAVESQAAIDAALDQLLRKAIQTKHLVRFRYKRQERIVEPHDYGIQNGIVRLFSWQVGGRSSGRIPGWRMFDVEGIQNCEMLDKRFAGNRDVPTGKHHRWDEIFIRVAAPSKI
jgi:predicted DNA-binding transcriptional regulator YafY